MPPDGAPPVLQVAGLRKAFGDVVAVEDVSLAVRAGEIVGLLGPNGAGKTTTASMACGLLPPDAGAVLVDGRPLAGDEDPARARIGFVPQEIALYEALSARENLRFFGALYGLHGAALDAAMGRVLALVGLEGRAGDVVRAYSGGMQRRLNMAAALMHDPALLLLDEPTVGVDPQSRNAIFDNLEQLRDQGKAILYTTHYMEEAERLCDRVVIVDHGRVVAEDTVRGLHSRLPARNRLRLELPAGPAADWSGLLAVPGVRAVEPAEGGLSVALDDVVAGVPAVLAWMAREGRPFTHLATERADLQAVFLALTGRSLRD